MVAPSKRTAILIPDVKEKRNPMRNTIVTITRSRFAKTSDKCLRTHTLAFAEESAANDYMFACMALDRMQKTTRNQTWEYIRAYKDVY